MDELSMLTCAPAHGDILMATPCHFERAYGATSAARFAVRLSDVKRFGVCRRYGDSIRWNIGELSDGRIVHFMHKDQGTDMLKLLKRRLKGVSACATRENDPAFGWELPPNQPRGDGEGDDAHG